MAETNFFLEFQGRILDNVLFSTFFYFLYNKTFEINKAIALKSLLGNVDFFNFRNHFFFLLENFLLLC